MTARAILLPQHVRLLDASVIGEAERQRRGYESITEPMDLEALGYAGYQCRAPGLLLPVHGVNGQVVGSFYRPDNPRRGANDRIIKYEAPAGARLHLDVPPAVYPSLGHPSRPLAITEGARKADAAVTAGLDCISIGGVWSWRGKNDLDGLTALGDWENVHFKGRPFFLIFDSDVLEKAGVNKALTRLQRFIESRDGHVRICYLPPAAGGAKLGLDDYLAAGGSVEKLMLHATTKLIVVPELFATNGNGHSAATLPVELDPEKPHLTDLGNAMRLVARHGQDLRHVHAWKRWLCWNGGYWEVDGGGGIEQRMVETILSLYRDASTETDMGRRGELIEHARRSERTDRVAAAIKAATGLPQVRALPADFDPDPLVLTVANGRVDLRTGDLSPPRREDLCTRSAAAPYDLGARCPRWEAFLARVIPDTQTRGFLKRAVGYSLTADMSEQVLFILYGLGANGKSTFWRVLRHVLGDYAKEADSATFLAKDRDLVRNDLARLVGTRFLAVSELDEGKRLSEALVKGLTAGEALPVRFLFGEFFDFSAQFKPWLATNHKPVVRGTEHAIWRRLKLVPFEVQIPESEQDPHLLDRLKEEAAGVLAWAVQGCLEWLEKGLDVPPQVEAATADYRTEMDRLSGFLADCCYVATTTAAGTAELFAAYSRYCERSGEERLSQTALGRVLTEKGFGEDRKGPGGARRRTGIGLRSDWDDGRFESERG